MYDRCMMDVREGADTTSDSRLCFDFSACIKSGISAFVRPSSNAIRQLQLPITGISANQNRPSSRPAFQKENVS